MLYYLDLLKLAWLALGGRSVGTCHFSMEETELCKELMCGLEPDSELMEDGL